MEETLYIYENSGKRRRAVKFPCVICGTEFLVRATGNHNASCCSPACTSLMRRKRMEKVCHCCGTLFARKPSKFKMSKHGYYFCSRTCKEKSQSLDGNCPEIRPTHYGTGVVSGRSLVTDDLACGCVVCGEKRQYLITVHHIDGNHNNNEIQNLEILCWNCHHARHLKNIDGVWTMSLSSLTPRDVVEELDAITKKLGR